MENNLSLLGAYRHYKGKEYEVIGIAKQGETLEEMVVYRIGHCTAKDDSGRDHSGCFWKRSKLMGNECVGLNLEKIRNFASILTENHISSMLLKDSELSRFFFFCLFIYP